MKKSRVESIATQKFNKKQVDVLVETKRVAAWISSSQQKAVLQLLEVECHDNPVLKEVIIKLLKWVEMFRPDKYRADMCSALECLICKLGFEDAKPNTEIIGIIEGYQSDGCAIPFSLIRNTGLYKNVSPSFVNVEKVRLAKGLSKVEKKKILIDNIASSIESRCSKDLKNLILVDDFVGTGNKVLRYVEAIQQVYPNVNLAVLSLMSLESGAQTLKREQKKRGFIFGCFEIVPQLNGERLTKEEVRTLARFEGKALRAPSNYVLGYEKSMALSVIAGHAASNNVFPLFWFSHKGEDNRPVLFGR